mmetsp:Transcript_158575/g.304218  ORF Transcript_158575/g.304218 Transcript_158575/m.304218 type:complete len:760 (+) Transcript_158575:187-2466(+)
MDDETQRLAWPGAARAVKRNATILRAVGLVVFVCLAILFSTAGIYLRSWRLQFKIQELKDYILIGNQPDTACQGEEMGEWVYGPFEEFMGCEARQREDFTRSDKEIYDQCVSTHEFERQTYCERGKEVHIFVFNITNPEDVVEGLTPRVQEIGRKSDGGPFVFHKDCKTFDTEFGSVEVEFSEYCYYTYKHSSTEAADLRQEIVTVNVGLLEAIGNSVNHIDYIVPVVWGTKALDALNATTTTAEDYIRGQLLSFSWPNNFGAHFLNHFSPEVSKAGFRARDNAKDLFEMVLDLSQEYCIINGTQYDRNQCISMANTLAIYARRYYESYQTYKIHPYNLKYKDGAGLFVRATVGDLLGYYGGHDDPLSAYMFPKKVSWNAVRSQTQVEVKAAVSAGMADAENGILNAGPQGRSSVISNTIEDLGSYTIFQGRHFVTEFDFQGCRPLADNGQVVVPPDGPYPPQCNGGSPLKVSGSRGMQVKPRVWSLQPGIDEQSDVSIFSETLMRPLKFSRIGDIELSADDNDVVSAQEFELKEEGLEDARMHFNCQDIYKRMSEAGVLNRGSDCDLHKGMFDLTPRSRNIPYVWSLPHFYLVTTNDSTQHPRNNLVGLVTPTGPRYRSLVVIEPESGRVLESMYKEQISVKLHQASQNYFFTKHKQVIIPLYWKHETKNATVADKKLLAGFQSSFIGLNAGFIIFTVLGGLSLVSALVFGMFLYKHSSLQSVQEKRKKIRAELQSARPQEEEAEVDDKDDDEDQEFV